MSTDAVLALQKQLMDVERRAKTLRNEVKQLEATRQSIEVSNNTETRVIEMLNNESADEPAYKSKTARKSAMAKKKSQASTGLPQDFIDDLTHRASDVSATIATHKKLLREAEDVENALAAATAKQQQIEDDYAELREIAGADEDGKSRSVAGTKKQNEFNYALKQLIMAYQERENIRISLRRQSAQLGRMAALVEETINAQEQKEEAKTVLAEKTAKLKELKAERARMERTVGTKDKNLCKKSRGLTEEEAVRMANMDRRVAMLELQREKEHIRSNRQAVRHRAMQIARAEKRLEMIGDAVGGNGLAEEERVDVEIVDSLMAELKDLYRQRAEADLRADMLDADIERLDYKCGALVRTTEGTRREMAKVEKEHQKYLNTLEKEVKQEEMINSHNIKTIEREITTLKSARRSAKSSAR